MRKFVNASKNVDGIPGNGMPSTLDWIRMNAEEHQNGGLNRPPFSWDLNRSGRGVKLSGSVLTAGDTCTIFSVEHPGGGSIDFSTVVKSLSP